MQRTIADKMMQLVEEETMRAMGYTKPLLSSVLLSRLHDKEWLQKRVREWQEAIKPFQNIQTDIMKHLQFRWTVDADGKLVDGPKPVWTPEAKAAYDGATQMIENTFERIFSTR